MTKRFFFTSALVALAIVCTALPSRAQRRDYMTEMEIELVRDSQDIDKRIEVLTKMIDRRFAALGIDVGGWKESGKDAKLWGDVPKGSPSELMSDIRKLLQKAIDDIDDVAEHNENTVTQNKKEGLLFPSAVRSLAAAAARYQPALKSLLDKTPDNRDKGVIITSIDSCEQIIDSVKNLPPEVKTDKKKAKGEKR